jgi:hypothetical protein
MSFAARWLDALGVLVLAVLVAAPAPADTKDADKKKD